MTDETKLQDDTASENTAAEAAIDPAGAEPAADTAEAVNARLQADVADLKDKLLRAVAETENVRRRTEREVGDARSYAIAKFAGDMLEVADNMDRSLASLPESAQASDEPVIKALREGAEMTRREMLRALEKHGVRKLDPKGERFDPNFHQAIVEIPDPNVPTGTVAQVMQVGYTIGSRVLRPAMVGVSKGGPKPEAAKAG